MPRYFFNVQDGRSISDEDGVELPNLAAVQREAVLFASRMLAGHSELFWKGEDWQVEVRDERGLLLFTLAFAAFKAPFVDALTT